MKDVGIGPVVKHAGLAEIRQYTEAPAEVIELVIILSRKTAIIKHETHPYRRPTQVVG